MIFSKSQKNAQINLQGTILCNFEIGSDASKIKFETHFTKADFLVTRDKNVLKHNPFKLDKYLLQQISRLKCRKSKQSFHRQNLFQSFHSSP